MPRQNRRRPSGSPRPRRREEAGSPDRSLPPSSVSSSSSNSPLLATAALVASLGVLGGASAFKLTSLLPFWGDNDAEGVAGAPFDEDDPLGALAYPRRNLAAELGEARYRAKITEALGEESGGGEQCEDGASECPAGGGGGIDASFPAHHARPSALTGDRRAFYDSYVKGCRDTYEPSSGAEPVCGRHESDRLDMNRNQPRIMRNYTDVGFLKTRAPGETFIRLKHFWNENRNKNRKREKWGKGDTFVNHWESPTYLIDLGDENRVIGGMDMRNAVWQGARKVLSEWTGVSEKDLTASSLYGIRVYERGAVLAPHVDRLPLVTSAVINVDQDVDEPWPLEVIAHDGRAYNVTLAPGEMLLYESHSVVHGRPYPLQGNYYANVFVHFEPRGHTQRHGERMDAFVRDGRVMVDSDEDMYRRAMEKAEAERKKPREAKIAGVNSAAAVADDLPDYIARGTPEEKRWKQQFVKVSPGTTTTTVTLDEALGKGKNHHADNAAWGGNAAHRAASNGDYDAIRDIAASSEQRHLLIKQDKNGWQPLHEAARGGYTKIVELLLDEGADVNARTNQGKGGNSLWWAEKTHGKNHPVTKLLRKRGAKSEGPTKG